MSRAPKHRSFRDRPATWDDLLDVPEDYIGEIVAGEVTMTPRPGLPHTQAASDLFGELFGPFRRGLGGPGGWIILVEPRVRFGEDIRVPDIAGWRRERWMELPRKGPIPLIPDWICEVLSPATAFDDRTAKRDLYARAKVRHLWLVDPEERTLEVHRLEGDGWRIVGNYAREQRVRAEPFDAIEIDLSLLWPPGAPEEAEE